MGRYEIVIGPSVITAYDIKSPVQVVQLRMTLILTKFPNSLHDTPIVSKVSELILHTKAPVI